MKLDDASCLAISIQADSMHTSRAQGARDMRPIIASAFAGLLVAGCAASSQVGSTALRHADSRFTGSWSVRWCDRTNPDLDCGGFSVTLRQVGDRVCGDFGGALVNLRQVDEGQIVGRVDGDRAILDVSSGRNDAVLRVEATRVGDDLHWKEVGTNRRGGSDISVIASDEVLKPSPPDRHPPTKDCNAPTS